jgi:hypothetical protein
MAVQGKGVERTYELIDDGFSVEYLLAACIKYMSNDEIVEMLSLNELWREPQAANDNQLELPL